jgi:putative ABC transport system permease protein
MKWIAVSFIISCPITYYAISKWLQNFAYKTNVSIWLFILSGIAILVLSMVAVIVQTMLAARTNPV